LLSRANMPLRSEVSLRSVLCEGTRSGQGFDSPKVHRGTPGSLTGAFMLLRCVSPFFRHCGRVAILHPARVG
jgi:hypothetical protein